MLQPDVCGENLILQVLKKNGGKNLEYTWNVHFVQTKHYWSIMMKYSNEVYGCLNKNSN